MKKAVQLRVHKKHTSLGIPVPGPLRLRRFSAGITLAEAARVAGVSLSRASLIERGIAVDPRDAEALDAALTQLSAVRA
jgi:predicted transcriptional regulator